MDSKESNNGDPTDRSTLLERTQFLFGIGAASWPACYGGPRSPAAHSLLPAPNP